MSNTQEQQFTCRHRIQASILLESPLHIGSGETRSHRLADDQKTEISTVMSDYQKKPYIPGASLRGHLRHALGQRGMSASKLYQVCGTEKKGQEQGGKLVVANCYLDESGSKKPDVIHALTQASSDCQGLPLSPARSDRETNRRLWNDERWTWITNGVSLDRCTRTASEHLLFHYEIVPPRARFTMIIDGLGLTDNELGWILTVLHDWQHTGGLILGKGRALGYGRCHITDTDVSGLCTHQELQNWLASEDIKATGCSHFPKVEQAICDEKRAAITPAAASSTCTIGLRLLFTGPFLVNDPSSCYPQDKRDNEQENDTGLGHVYLGDHRNNIILPGRSFKGAFRSQVEKIARTMLDCQPHSETIPCLPEQLMQIACYPGSKKLSCPEIKQESELNKLCLACRLCGAKGFRSPLMVSDFSPESTEDEGCLRLQEFVAIDRFTGGAAPEKKFNALQRERPVLTGTIALDLSLLDSARIGLFVLALRDLLEGDISFGFGRSKGYGQCRAEISGIQLPGHWPDGMEDKAHPVREFFNSCQGKEQPFAEDECRLNAGELVEQLEKYITHLTGE